MEKENYFLNLQKIQCEVEKKNWLNYISWSDWWAELKKVHPNATYRKVKNWDTYLFKSWTGWSVECEVTVWDITHCADLAVTDFKNQEIKYESIKSTDIQNTLQRAFAKAIAMHGIGLYVYRWEDFPDDLWEEKSDKKEETKKGTWERWFNYEDLLYIAESWIKDREWIEKIIREDKYKVSKNAGNAIAHYLKTWEVLENLFFTAPK